MSDILFIGLGGALGAVARHSVTQVTLSQSWSTSVGTFVVNISGTFLLGLLAGLLSSYPTWPTEIKISLIVSFLASYTTFSTLSLATIHSLEKGDLSSAVVNLGTSVSLGLMAAVAGMMFGRAI